MKNISRFKKSLFFTLLISSLALALSPLAVKVYQNIIFKRNGFIPITVNTQKYVDLVEGRITEFSTSQYSLYRRLDKSSKKLYIDVFDLNGNLLGSSMYELPLSIRQ